MKNSNFKDPPEKPSCMNITKMLDTCILDGFRTSNEADALKDKVANGLESVVAFTMVIFLVSIA